MTPEKLRQKLDDLKNFVTEADNSIRSGNMVDVRSLEKDVAVVCKDVLALPADEARNLQPLMADLIGELERLSLSLKDYKDTLKS